MNKAYRLVWSERQDRFIAVPEFARSHGKGGECSLLAALTLSALFISPAGAQVNVAAGSTTTVTNAANGVPVVAIAKANTAGLSHNQYNKFNVDSQGLVLNNNAAAGAVPSQLAGAVAQNTKLSAAARLILNEVVINNRSALKGYMEVAGTRAGVVVANPWGITCNGCGFINTDRATLSTGVPVFAGDGSLDKLRVSGGDIRIEGTGLQGQGANILDLVARSLVVDGQIKANDLQLVAGSNDYNYAQRSATAIAASGAAPSYAIDSTALGGMYAQKIALIATENGVGVRLLGDAAASASDFTLTAARMIELNAKSISAKDNLAVTSRDAKIVINPAASLSAGVSLALNAGDTVESSGNVKSNGSMTLSSGSIVRNYGTLKASGVLNVKSSVFNNLGKTSSDEGFKFDLWRLLNGSESNFIARIESTQDRGNSSNASSIVASSDVINYGSIHAADDLSINAKIIQNQGTGGITSGRALNLTAANTIENRGALYSGDRGVDLQAQTITNYTGATIEAVTDISAKSSVFNNYSVIRGDTIAVTTDTRFYNGLETAITPVLDTSKTVSSAASEPTTQIDFWQETRCSACNERTLFQDAITYREQYSSPLPVVKPQLLALDTLTLDYGNGSATNYAGVISGDLVSITGSGAFTNQDVSLFDVTYYRRALDYKQNALLWWNASHAYLAATAATPLTNANISNGERSGLASYASVPDALGHSALFEKGRVSYSSTGAGVYANTLYVSAGQVKNQGAPFSYGDSRLAQGGFSIDLPTNPNGHYVLSGKPKSRYLVVTNPDFVSQAADANSYELEKLMGYNPDDELLRIGDSDYEDSLVCQQLISANASQLLAGNDLEEINRLRANAVAEFRAQKLIYGQALTPQQIKGLSHDIVWMEKTKVGNKEALVPRVYLSASTQAMLTGGAVLAAKNTTINAASVSNSGATIAGAQNLAIKTSGNITNESGTITGGNVSMAATGNIDNKTLTQAQGNSRTFKTTLGKTGRIEATTESLEISSGQQIQSRGAEVKAARNANLTAVGAITLEGIENKTTTSKSITNSTQNKKSKKNTQASDTKTETTVVNIGSSVVAGNQLKLTSGADITLKGSKTTAGGAVEMQSKGDVKVLADQNKTMMHSESKAAGRGVNGGLWGKKKQTTDETKSTNSGSTLAAAGDGKVNTSGALTVQGSQLKIGGNATLTAGQGIAVVDGKNENSRTTQTQSTAFLKRGDSNQQASTDKPLATATAANGQATAKTSAGAKAGFKADFKLYESSSTTDKTSATESVGSTLAVGGNLKADTEKNMAIQGSSVSAGKAMSLNANTLDVTTGSNTTKTSSTTSGFALGAFTDGNAKASAQAKSEARGSGGGGAASASASAKASAETNATFGVKTENENKAASTLTHTSSELKSGGNMDIAATGQAAFAGAKVESAGSLDIKGRDITNKAVQNTTESSTSKTSHLAGINLSGSASAGASANAGVQAGLGASAEAAAKVEAKAEGTAGLRYKNEQDKGTKETVTQVTNSFTAKNDITRTATETLKDQGTKMTAGGNITQSARLITDEAVSNSTMTSGNTQTHDARLGAQAGASAEVGGSLNASLIGAVAGAKPLKQETSAGAGFKASYQGGTSANKEKTTADVTSSYTAGNSISSTSAGKTSLEGSQLKAGKDINLNAGALDFKAAKDTSSSSGTKNDVNASLTVTVVGTTGGNLAGNYKGKTDSSESSTARAGSLEAGGDIKVKIGGDASFTGTQLKSDGKISLDAQGDAKFSAAQSTRTSSSQDLNANAGIKGGGGSGSGNIGAAYSNNGSSSTTGQGAKIEGKGGIDLSAGKSATFEGTKIKSSGDVNIAAKEQVNLLETTKKESATSTNVGAGFNAKYTKTDDAVALPAASGGTPSQPASSGGTPQQSAASGGTPRQPAAEASSGSASPEAAKPAAPPTMGANANWRKSEQTTSTATSIDAGGKINVKGGTVVNQEAKLVSGQGKPDIEGPTQSKAQSNAKSLKGLEFTAGSPTKKIE